MFNDDILILYDGDNREPFFFGYYGGLNRIEGVWRGSQIEKWFEASSWLTEGSYIYKPENMADLKTKEPWVEGVAGYGRGEKIIIKSYAKTLYILNGFYSYNMPWLWRQYSRIKKIRIAYLDNPEIEPFEVEIEDSPKLQKISGLYLNKFLGAESLEIEILEVYEGTHFDDTCINGIIVSAGE